MEEEEVEDEATEDVTDKMSQGETKTEPTDSLNAENDSILAYLSTRLIYPVATGDTPPYERIAWWKFIFSYLHLILRTIISEINELGYRKCYFTMNGQARTISIFDKTSDATIETRELATNELGSLGASINGSVVGIKVENGSSLSHIVSKYV